MCFSVPDQRLLVASPTASVLLKAVVPLRPVRWALSPQGCKPAIEDRWKLQMLSYSMCSGDRPTGRIDPTK
jgi:hypothetical protein